MKILIIGPYGEGLLPVSYAKAFEAMGHEVFWFDSLREHLLSRFYRDNTFLRRILRGKRWDSMNRKVVELISTLKPDLVLAFKGEFLHPETIRGIRSHYGLPILNYYPDNPYCGVPLIPDKTSSQRRDIIECLKEYTLIFTWSKQLVQRLLGDGANAEYLPFGVDCFTYKPKITGIDDRFKTPQNLVFVGQRSRKRERHLAKIGCHKVTIWGPLWEKASKKVRNLHEIKTDRAFGKACASIYNNTDIALNIVDDLNMPGHNMRTFEIPASGTVMISTYTDEQNDFFPEGEAACYYHHPSELDDIIEKLLKDKPMRERINSAAFCISKEHSYIKRADALLKIYSFQ